MQLADSFFPSGAFGMSAGLEALVRSRRVKDGRGVLEFIRRQLHFQLTPCDCAVMLSVMSAAKRNDLQRAIAADNAYFSMKLVREARTASTRSGRQVLSCVLYIMPNKFARRFHSSVESGRSPGTQPACLAVAADSLAIPEKSAVRMMLYSYCVSITGSAIRLGLLQHLEAQRILTKLRADIDSVNAEADFEHLWQLCPLVEILQTQHERDDLRMFIT
jgi:urease accessory protein